MLVGRMKGVVQKLSPSHRDDGGGPASPVEPASVALPLSPNEPGEEDHPPTKV